MKTDDGSNRKRSRQRTSRTVLTYLLLGALAGVSFVPFGSEVARAKKNGEVPTFQADPNPIRPPSLGDALALNRQGTRGYVSLYSGGGLLAIDPANDTLSQNMIPTGGRTTNVEFSPDGTYAYANLVGTNGFIRIDSSTDQVTSLPATVGKSSAAIAFRPDGAKAFLMDDAPGAFVPVDTATGEALGLPIVGGSNIRNAAYSPDGKKLYATSSSGQSGITVIDDATDAIETTIPLIPKGANPNKIAFTPDGKYALVSQLSAAVNVIDVAQGRAIKSIPGTEFANALAISNDGTFALVGQLPGNAEVSVPGQVVTVDLSTFEVVGDPVTVGPSPTDVALTPDARKAYVMNGVSTNTYPPSVSVLRAGVAPVVTSADHATGQAGAVLPTFTFTASGDPAEMTWSTPGAARNATAPGAGRIPKGLSVSADGKLSGTIDSSVAPGDYSFTVQAANGVAPDGTQTFTVRVTGFHGSDSSSDSSAQGSDSSSDSSAKGSDSDSSSSANGDHASRGGASRSGTGSGAGPDGTGSLASTGGSSFWPMAVAGGAILLLLGGTVLTARLRGRRGEE